MKVRFRPAKPSKFPDQGPIDARQALQLLNRSEFALWVALCACPDCVDHKLSRFAKLLGLTSKRTNLVAKELHLKGFITIVRDAQKAPLRAHVVRPLLVSPQAEIEIE